MPHAELSDAYLRTDRPIGSEFWPAVAVLIPYVAVSQPSDVYFVAWGASTLLRATSIASRRSLGNMSRVTMAVTANNRAKSGVRYKSPSGCSIDSGTTVQSEAMQARTRLSVVDDPTAPLGSKAKHAIVAGISATAAMITSAMAPFPNRRCQ